MSVLDEYLTKLNSATKYPPIPTYHWIDSTNGILSEDKPVYFGDGVVLGTEKVDGTNARIIVDGNGDVLIGSREELLYALGDRIANPALGIVNAIKDVARRLGDAADGTARVFYGEVYGGGIGGQWKNYTKTKQQTGFRLFDVAVFDDIDEIVSWPLEKIAGWRDRGGQTFLPEMDLVKLALAHDIDLVPRVITLDASEMPTSITDMADLVGKFASHTLVALDLAHPPGRAEGLVWRSTDRRVIAKARFEDYRKTLRRHQNAR